MKKETYKTDHPTIKELSIGDKFELENGTIVTFIYYDGDDKLYPFKMNNTWYTSNLKYVYGIQFHYKNIKYKLPKLKDKIDML